MEEIDIEYEKYAIFDVFLYRITNCCNYRGLGMVHHKIEQLLFSRIGHLMNDFELWKHWEPEVPLCYILAMQKLSPPLLLAVSVTKKRYQWVTKLFINTFIAVYDSTARNLAVIIHQKWPILDQKIKWDFYLWHKKMSQMLTDLLELQTLKMVGPDTALHYNISKKQPKYRQFEWLFNLT